MKNNNIYIYYIYICIIMCVYVYIYIWLCDYIWLYDYTCINNISIWFHNWQLNMGKSMVNQWIVEVYLP
jgi:hypothetical protein